ncbi:MAG: hypothetical protein M3069_33375 [Chloroflexota bacterium]|nr:hypothetical protein [Chloroflexota bacterium]
MQVMGVFGDLERGQAAVERLRLRQFDAQHLDLVAGGEAPADVSDAAAGAAATQAGPEESVAAAIFEGRLPAEQLEELMRRLRDRAVALLVTTSDEHPEDQAIAALREAGGESITRLA